MKSIPFFALIIIVGLLLALAPQALADDTPAGMRCMGKAVVDGREVPIYVPVTAAEPAKAPKPVVTTTTPAADEVDEEVVVVQAPPAPPATIIVVQAPPPAPITINNVNTNTNTATATATSAPAAAPTGGSWFKEGDVKYHTPRRVRESAQYAPAPVACPPQGGGCNEPFVFAPSVTFKGGDRTLVQAPVREHQRRGGWGPAPVREHQRRAPCPPRRRHR